MPTVTPTLPGATLGLRAPGTHGSQLAIFHAVEGVPSGGLIGSQELGATQVAVAVRIDPAGYDSVLYVTLDGGTTWTALTNVAFDPQDTDALTFGTGDDIAIAWDGTRLNVTQAAPNSEIRWGVSGAGIDQKWYGDTAGSDLTWDQSADSLLFGDNAKAVFGTGSDIAVTWNATKLVVSQAAPNSAIDLGVSGAGIDLQLYGDTAGRDLLWDQSADSLLFADDAKLALGTGSDITASWNGTKLLIAQAAPNSAIDFGVDGAGIDLVLYGDTASAACTWDQSADSLILSGVAKLALTGTASITRATLGVGASTAAAGTTTADAGVLPAATGSVYPTSAADDTKGVRVHADDKVTGRTLYICNGVSNKILKVYAPSGGTINGAAADAAFSSASGKGVTIICLDSGANTWAAF